jgi:hypothetical protein
VEHDGTAGVIAVLISFPVLMFLFTEIGYERCMNEPLGLRRAVDVTHDQTGTFAGDQTLLTVGGRLAQDESRSTFDLGA